MIVEEFNEILNKSLSIVHAGIKKGYFKEEDKEILISKLIEVLKKGIVKDISGTAIYGEYSLTQKRLCYNAKVFKDEKEALIYILHEMKHALDDNELSIGFELKSEGNGVGMNEGATQRFATDIAEEILGEKIPETMQSSLGITLNTNLDEYQIEDKMNELFCRTLGISRAEFLRMQNENDLESINILKQRFNEFADFDAFEKSVDEIYAIQEETWIDENGNLLEQEAEPTPEQTARAKELIRQCQSQILQFVEKCNPEKLEDIKGEMIMIDGEIMNNQEMLYQEDYLKYQEFITKGLNLSDYNLVYISGLGGFPFEEVYEGETSMKQLLETSTEPFTETIYLRQGDEYKMATVTFDKKGAIGMSEMQTVTSFDNILGDILASDIIGNAEEYIRMLRLQGNDVEAQNVQRKYEYFMNNRNRIPEMRQHINERAIDPEIEEIMRRIADGEEISFRNADIPEIEPDEGEIVYNGITISSRGHGINQYGEIMMQIPDEVIDRIELAVEQGQLVLTDAQKQTLLKAKQNFQPQEVSEQAFQVVDEEEVVISEHIIYQEDYLKYQEFITKGLDLKGYNLVYISGLERYNSFEEIFEEQTSMKQLLESATEPFTETIYLRQGNEYKKATVTFDKTGVIGISEMEEVTSFDDILEGLELADAIGNPEEHIRILLLQGNEEATKQIRRDYENFLKNRSKIPSMLKHKNQRVRLPVQDEFDTIMRTIADGPELGTKLFDVPTIETADGKIEYNGITIFSSGTGGNECGEIMSQIPDEVVNSIELAVKQGQLVLTDAQKQTLLKAKQKSQDKEVSKQDFKEVAENSIAEKDAAFNELKQASQEPEKDSNIQSQGE